MRSKNVSKSLYSFLSSFFSLSGTQTELESPVFTNCYLLASLQSFPDIFSFTDRCPFIHLFCCWWWWWQCCQNIRYLPFMGIKASKKLWGKPVLCTWKKYYTLYLWGWRDAWLGIQGFTEVRQMLYHCITLLDQHFIYLSRSIHWNILETRTHLSRSIHRKILETKTQWQWAPQY